MYIYDPKYGSLESRKKFFRYHFDEKFIHRLYRFSTYHGSGSMADAIREENLKPGVSFL